MKTKNLFKSKFTVVLTAVLFLSFLISSCNQKTTDNKIDEAQKAKEELMLELTYSCINFWISGNFSLINELVSPEFIRHLPGGDDIVGIEAIKEEINNFRTGFPDLDITIDLLSIKDDLIIYKVTLSGTHTGVFVIPPFGEIPPTGNTLVVNGLEIDHIVDGQIVEEWVYYDQLDILSQLGFNINITPPENQDK